MPEFSDVSRRSVLAAGTGALALPVAGCLSGDEEGKPGGIDPETIDRGGVFTVGLADDLETFNPLTARSAPANALLDLFYQPGVIIDPAGFDAMPWVFADWEAEETEGGMAIHASVREDLQWTDGEPLTAADVRFTYEYYRDQQPARYRSAIDPIESVEAAGNGHDLTLALDRVVGAYAAELLSVRLLAEHVWGEVDDHAAYDPEEPVGLGPGRLVGGDFETGFEIELLDEWPLSRQDWVADHDLLIERGPFLDSIEIRVFEGEDALYGAFLDGSIDAISGGAFDPARARAIAEHENRGLIAGHDDGYGHYTLNMRVPPLDDQAFRQALSMAMNRRRWVDIESGYAIPGSVVVPPGFDHLRPETSAGEPVQKTPAEDAHPALGALWFRSRDGALDVGAIRDFLESGAVIDGSEGSYAGREYPGSLTNFGGTFQTEAAHDYAFGEVESSTLEGTETDRELYVDGRTIVELNDGPITLLTPPPETAPRAVEFTREYVENLRSLGIPVELESPDAHALAERAYLDADFDIYLGNWPDISPRGIPSLYELFHSDNAHGEESGFATLGYNAAGYGLEGLPGADDAIAEARAELGDDRRNELVREIAERLYLEAPTLVRSYRWRQWPVNTADFAGFMADIPNPGSSNRWVQALTVHQR